MNEKPKLYMDTDAVASLLDIPSATVRYWRHVGAGPRSFKVGRRVRYARDDVDAYIEEQRAAARAGSSPASATTGPAA